MFGIAKVWQQVQMKRPALPSGRGRGRTGPLPRYLPPRTTERKGLLNNSTLAVRCGELSKIVHLDHAAVASGHDNPTVALSLRPSNRKEMSP